MELYVRNLTKNKELTLVIPMPSEKLDSILGADEFIILDSDKLGNYIGELANIKEINNIMNDIDDLDTFELLCTALYDIKEAYKVYINGDYSIIDFDSETSVYDNTWNFFSENDKGRLLYELGFKALPFEIDDDYLDWIDFTGLYNEAVTGGNFYEVDNRYMIIL